MGIRAATMGKIGSGAGSRARPGARTRMLASLPMASAMLSRLVAQRLRSEGIELQPVLRQAGLTRRQIDDPEQRLPAGSQIAFLAAAAVAAKDDLLGFRLAQGLDCRELGLLYYVFASSETLGEALRRCARYSRVANESVALHVVESGRPVIRLHYAGVARHTDVQQMEFIMTVLLRICRHTTGHELVPERTSMVHVRPEVPHELSRFFGARMEFGSGVDEMVLPAGAARLRLVNADPYLNKIIVEDCETALAQRRLNVGAFRIRVENVIAPLLPHGSARASSIARALGMSERTMGRKLAQEGSSFAEILRHLKSEMAVRYIEDPDVPISRIAWLLGFEDVSSFSHAFKRWTGQSPRRMRNAAPSQA